MDRHPPRDVQRQLRQEVGFGCPIPVPDKSCGCPYLEWHHFDPTWRERQHHNPAGMIALCPKHHKKADGNSWTKEQLREFKQSGRGNFSHVRGRFDWMRRKLLGVVGGNFSYDCPILFYCSQQPIIWFTRDTQGYLRVNISRPQTTFSAQPVMEDNDWQVSRDVADIECPPRGHFLAVRYPNGDLIQIRFRELANAQEAMNAYPGFAGLASTPIRFSYPLTAVEMEMQIPALGIDIDSKRMRLPNGSELIGCSASQCPVGFAFGKLVHRLGVGAYLGDWPAEWA